MHQADFKYSHNRTRPNNNRCHTYHYDRQPVLVNPRNNVRKYKLNLVECPHEQGNTRPSVKKTYICIFILGIIGKLSNSQSPLVTGFLLHCISRFRLARDSLCCLTSELTSPRLHLVPEIIIKGNAIYIPVCYCFILLLNL